MVTSIKCVCESIGIRFMTWFQASAPK